LGDVAHKVASRSGLMLCAIVLSDSAAQTKDCQLSERLSTNTLAMPPPPSTPLPPPCPAVSSRCVGQETPYQAPAGSFTPDTHALTHHSLACPPHTSSSHTYTQQQQQQRRGRVRRCCCCPLPSPLLPVGSAVSCQLTGQQTMRGQLLLLLPLLLLPLLLLVILPVSQAVLVMSRTVTSSR